MIWTLLGLLGLWALGGGLCGAVTEAFDIELEAVDILLIALWPVTVPLAAVFGLLVVCIATGQWLVDKVKST